MKKKTVNNILKALLGLGIIVVGVFGMQYMFSLKEDPPKKTPDKRIKAVETRRINNGDLATTLDVQGRLQAYNKIELYSEVGGVVEESSRPLKEGTYFPEGEVILRINAEEARLNLLAQKATLLNSIAQLMPDLKIDYPSSFAGWEAYLNAFDVEAPLPALPTAVDQREKLFVAGRNLYTQYYTIKSLEDRLSKYVILAPFSGYSRPWPSTAGPSCGPGRRWANSWPRATTNWWPRCRCRTWTTCRPGER